MKAVRPFKQPVTLADMKGDPALADLSLLRLSRLSVAPVSAEHWRHICKLGKTRAGAR
jgi:predicted RNA-binding protein with PUA-like domain